MVNDSLEEMVKQFVAQELACRPERLTSDTRLLHDLGVDGVDGWEFMEAFSQRFGVDMAEFNTNLHFGPEEGCNPLVVLVILVTRTRIRFIPITVGDLVEAARSKRWHTPDREPL